MNRAHAQTVIAQSIDLEFADAAAFFRRSPSADAFNRMTRLMHVVQFWHTLEPGQRASKTDALMAVPMTAWLGKLYDDATRGILLGDQTFSAVRAGD